MDSASYIGLAGQLALIEKQRVNTNNIANANTAGFKRKFIIAHNTHSEYGPFAENIGESADRSVSLFSKTDNPFNLALGSPNAYFKVMTPNGEKYTRNGNFNRNVEGLLVTAEGYSVLGVEGGPIEIPLEAQSIVIDGTGDVYIKGAVTGKVGVFNLLNFSSIKTAGNSLISYTGNDAVIEQNPKISQGMLEGSNVDAITETSDMLANAREMEQINKMIGMIDSMSDRLIRSTVNDR